MEEGSEEKLSFKKILASWSKEGYLVFTEPTSMRPKKTKSAPNFDDAHACVKILLTGMFSRFLVHFSSKVTNSNIVPGGIRVAAANGQQGLPYVSVGALLGEGRQMPVDYISNSGGAWGPLLASKLAKYLDHCLSDSDESGIPAKDRAAVRATHASATATAFTSGLDSVALRHRQLLLPQGDGYVSMTPLGSAGLCRMINEGVRVLKKDEGAWLMQSDRDGFPIGGANSQNVGCHARYIAPLLFEGPTEDPGVKRALSFYFRGFRPQIPRQLVSRYEEVLNNRGRNGKRPGWSLSEKQRESEILAEILVAVERQAEAVGRDVRKHLGDTPEEIRRVNDLFSIGWMLRSERSLAWSRLTAGWLAEELRGFALRRVEEKPVLLGLSQDDCNRILKSTKKLLCHSS